MQLDALIRRLARRIAALPPISILAIGWVVIILYSFPGIMTLDSFDQLRQGRLGQYTDRHPPAFAALWHWIDHVVPGPPIMLVIQATAFLAGLYLVLLRTFAPRRAGVAATLLLLFPPVFAPMTVIWKEAWMAAFLVIGIAGLLDARRGVRIAALGAMFVACAVQFNAPAATLPLIVVLFEWSPTPPTWRGRFKRYAIASGAWLAVTCAAIGVNAKLTTTRMHFWHSSIAVMDIAGSLALVDDQIPDDTLRATFAGSDLRIDKDIHATLRARYKPWDFSPLIGGDDRLWDLPIMHDIPAPTPRREAIGRAWWTIVSEHPLEYFQQRLATFAEVLAFPRKIRSVMVMTHGHQPELVAGSMGLAVEPSGFQIAAQRVVVNIAKHTPLFRPYVYFVIAVALMLLSRRHRDVFALLCSGLVMELSLVPLAATPDFRFSHWLVVCTCLAVVILTARRMRPTPSMQL